MNEPVEFFGEDDRAKASMQTMIVKARSGCVVSQGQLLAELRNYLLLVADKEVEPGLRAKAGPSDAVQLTMLRVSQRIGAFRGSTEKELLAWVREILLNEVKQIRRSFKAEKRDMGREVSMELGTANQNRARDPSDPLLTPQSAALLKEESDGLRTAIAALSDDYRQVIELRNWRNLSFSEIAELMNRSENAVTKLWFRALVKLEQQLGSSP